jgi:hypothetical protein
VTFHIGDSHELLPVLLDVLARAGENVDFAFVDGDHSASGVQRDVEDLLSSPSVGRSVILLHDTLNERVRAGLDAVDYGSFAKVSFVDLDFLPGQILRKEEGDEPWCGLGVILVGWDVPDEPVWYESFAAPEVVAGFLRVGASGEARSSYHVVAALEQEITSLTETLERMRRSWSWRLTAPFRRAGRLTRRKAGRP